MPDQTPAAPPAEEKKRERYNTQFLVGNFEREQRRTRMILLAIVGALVLAGVIGVFVQSHRETPPGAPKTDAVAPPKADIAPPVPATK